MIATSGLVNRRDMRYTNGSVENLKTSMAEALYIDEVFSDVFY